jgi:hypothetical protein
VLFAAHQLFGTAAD